MYTKREHVNTLYEATNKKFSKAGVGDFIDPLLMDSYQELLQTISNKSQYQEGERIMPSDLARINQTVKMVIDDMKSNMLRNIPKIENAKPRLEYDIFSAMVSANDHLFSMAMKTLGCPDMPAHFGSEVTDHIEDVAVETKFELNNLNKDKSANRDHYKMQRGKSAERLRKRNSSLTKPIKDKTASPFSVLDYVAEYQALKKRQDGHGFFWKLFHLQENSERNKLLEEMKDALSSAVGKDVNLEKDSPDDIARNYHRQTIKDLSKDAFREDAIGKRNQVSDNMFEHEATATNRAETDKEKDDPFSGIILDEEFRENMHFDKGDFEEFENGKMIDLSSREVDLVTKIDTLSK